MDRIIPFVPISSLVQLTSLPNPISSNDQGIFLLRPLSSNNFSIKAAYKFLANLEDMQTHTKWKAIWK